MKLYFSPGACSLSPHIVLHEAGLKHDAEKVDLRAKKTESGADFRAINPKGQVPALVLDDGSLLTEGPAIVQYLADLKPEAKLAPANGTMPRYRLQEWLNYISTEIHKQFTPLFLPTTPDAAKEAFAAKLMREFGFLDSELAKRNWLAGDSFSVADAYLFTVSNWAQYVKLDLSAYTNLLAYRKRVAARPGVQAALKAEGLSK
jgi:glutathione S-transferase